MPGRIIPGGIAPGGGMPGPIAAEGTIPERMAPGGSPPGGVPPGGWVVGMAVARRRKGTVRGVGSPLPSGCQIRTGSSARGGGFSGSPASVFAGFGESLGVGEDPWPAGTAGATGGCVSLVDAGGV
ncbi:MAG: hypothetical protein ACKOPT_09220, partial [Cyanobium sp.]